MHMLAHLLKRRDFPLSWTLASEERCKWSVSAAEVSAFTDTQGSGRRGGGVVCARSHLGG